MARNGKSYGPGATAFLVAVVILAVIVIVL